MQRLFGCIHTVREVVTDENQTTGVSFKKKSWDIFGFGQLMAYGSWSLKRDCLLNLYFIDVYHKFLQDFQHVNSITSTMHISNTQEGQ